MELFTHGGRFDFAQRTVPDGVIAVDTDEKVILINYSQQLFGTQAEYIYYWGLSDTLWVGALVAYGLIGFLLVSLIQIYYGFTTFKILKKTNVKDIYILFIILFFTTIIFRTLSYSILIFGLWGPSFIISFYIAIVTYKYEHLSG